MARLYEKKHLMDRAIIVLLIAVVTGIFIVRQPRVFALFFPRIAQTQTLNTWISYLKKDTSIDLVKWSEFREMYSPGAFTYDSKYLMPYSILQFIAVDPEDTQFVSFNSKHLHTEEHLLSPGKCDEARNTIKAQAASTEKDTQVIFSEQNSLVKYDPSLNEISLIFVRSLEELKKNNGLIDYIDPKKLLTDQCWLTEAKIQTPKSWRP